MITLKLPRDEVSDIVPEAVDILYGAIAFKPEPVKSLAHLQVAINTVSKSVYYYLQLFWSIQSVGPTHLGLTLCFFCILHSIQTFRFFGGDASH